MVNPCTATVVCGDPSHCNCNDSLRYCLVLEHLMVLQCIATVAGGTAVRRNSDLQWSIAQQW